MSNKVYAGQSFFDKALEITGSVENAFAMAVLNNKSITDTLIVGEELKPSIVTAKGIVNLFSKYNRPATGITNQNHELIVADEGIGAMIIEDTFIVR